MSRFFVDAGCVDDALIYIEDPDDIKHIKKVLRMKKGDELEISDSQEFEYKAVIESIEDGCVSCRITDKQRFLREPDTKITLFQGIPKQGKMEVIVQKCTELGINRVVPVFTGRTVVVDKGNFGKKIDRWQKVAAESVKQCRRGIIPEVSEAHSFEEMRAELAGGSFDLVLFLYENEEGTTIKDVMKSFLDDNKEGRPFNVAVVIGPEGGFSDREAEEIVSSGGKSASLGRTILRTETAGAAAVAMAMYEFEL